MKPIITYEEFESYINEMKSIDELQANLNALIRSYNHSNKEDVEYIRFPTLFDSIVELLQKVTGDTHEYTNLWIYELDFGREYKDGCIKRENGEDVPLKTTRDLWNKITEDNDNDAD